MNVTPSNPQRARSRHGFSLIEVLFAVFLAGVCATILAATMPVANSSRARADMNNKATSLAQKQLEGIRGLGYANATAPQLYAFKLIDSTTPVSGTTNKYSFTNVDTAAKDNPALLLPSGQGFVKLEQVDLDLRRVTVEIRYVERNKTRTITIGTLIANL